MAIVDMREYIKEQCELAQIYAEDGAYISAARVLSELADVVRNHAITSAAEMQRAFGGKRNRSD